MLRMLEHPKLRPPQTSTDMPAVDAPFDDDGWRQLLDEGDVEAAWLLLSRAAEDQLRRCGRVVGSERHPRGSLPKVVPSTSRIGAGQSHRERQLRRSVRLAQEVRRASSSPIPADLARKLGTALRREGGDPKLVQQRRWREIEQYFHGLLNALLQAENRQALSEWRQRVQNPSQAIAWVKNDVRPPLVVDVEEGTRAGPSAVAEAMRSWWSSLWSTTAAQDLDHLRERLDNMCRAAGRNVSPDQLQPLQAADLQAVLRSMLPKATGLDGWEAQALLALTPLMFDRFVFFLQEVERLQQWPDALCAWRVVYIPKKISRNPGSYRPIAVGAILYRAWAKLRASQVARKFSSSFAPTQGGGRGVPDAPVLVMDILQRQHEGWVYGAAFDLEKAFDSMHSDLAVDVMLRHGLHPSVAGCLRDAWNRQVRWIMTTGAYASQPVTCHVLPQGDPFSPWALSLWMGLLVQEVQRRVPDIIQYQFLDDRTALGRTVQSFNGWWWRGTKSLLMLASGTMLQNFRFGVRALGLRLSETSSHEPLWTSRLSWATWWAALKVTTLKRTRLGRLCADGSGALQCCRSGFSVDSCAISHGPEVGMALWHWPCPVHQGELGVQSLAQGRFAGPCSGLKTFLGASLGFFSWVIRATS